MSLNARFTASFDEFKRQVDGANTTLGVFERGTKNAARELTRLEESYSGQRIIASAIRTAEAVERIGGVTKLTGSELESIGRIADEATEKLNKVGEAVPASLAALNKQLRMSRDDLSQYGVTAVDARSKVSGLSDSYRQFDGVLQGAGIHIGPQVKAIEDIAGAAGKSIGQIGALGTAGLALGTGMAAWGITRAAMEFLGLDKNVESAWRSLLHYGDVAEQVAGAKQDTINRAIALGAKATISYKEAIEFIPHAQKQAAEASINWTEKLATAHREVRNLTEAQIKEIEIAQQAGATTEQITAKYHVSAEGLKILADRQRDAAAATREHETAQRALDKAYDKLMSDTKNANQLAIQEADAAKMAADKQTARQKVALSLRDAIYESAKASNSAAKFEQELFTEQQKVDQENKALIDSYTKAGQAATEGNGAATASAQETTRAYAGVAQQITITGEAMREWLNLQVYAAKANAILSENSLFTSTSQRQRIAEIPGAPAGPVMTGGLPAGNPRLASVMNPPKLGRGGIAMREQVVTVGDTGPEAIVPLPKLAQLGGAGGSVSVVVNLSGVLLSNDPGGKKVLRDSVGIAVFEALSRGKKV